MVDLTVGPVVKGVANTGLNAVKGVFKHIYDSLHDSMSEEAVNGSAYSVEPVEEDSVEGNPDAAWLVCYWEDASDVEDDDEEDVDDDDEEDA